MLNVEPTKCVFPVLATMPEPILEYAAKRGFHGSTLEVARKMFDALNVPFQRGKKPRTKGDFLRLTPP